MQPPTNLDQDAPKMKLKLDWTIFTVIENSKQFDANAPEIKCVLNEGNRLVRLVNRPSILSSVSLPPLSLGDSILAKGSLELPVGGDEQAIFYPIEVTELQWDSLSMCSHSNVGEQCKFAPKMKLKLDWTIFTVIENSKQFDANAPEIKCVLNEGNLLVRLMNRPSILSSVSLPPLSLGDSILAKGSLELPVGGDEQAIFYPIEVTELQWDSLSMYSHGHAREQYKFGNFSQQTLFDVRRQHIRFPDS